MSQYFNSWLNFINFVFINYFVCLSFCDNQTIEVIFYNNTALEIIDKIIDTIDSNSSPDDQNKFLTRDLISNNTRFKTNEYASYRLKCQHNYDCRGYGICCPFEKSSSSQVCINSGQSTCRGVLFQECNSSISVTQCEPAFDLFCLPVKNYGENKHECQCKEGQIFNFIQIKCEDISYEGGSAMQIYKITMIFASCCLALILIIFLVCILRKSYCTPRRQGLPLDNTTIPDIFTLFPHVGNYDGGPLADGTLPPFEKPPTYDETLTLIRNEIGIPPPAYRSGNSPNSSNPSTPDMSTRILISNPSLFTVSNVSENNSRTNLATNSSSDESSAGPSGSSTSHQGIDNPAFC